MVAQSTVTPPPPKPPTAVAAPAPAAPPQDPAAAALNSLPLFDTLRTADPAMYAEVLNLVRRGVDNGTPEAALIAQAHAMFESQLSKYVLAGTDTAVVGYYRMLAARMETALKNDVPACYAMVTGKPAPAGTAIGADEFAQTMTALTNLVKSMVGRTPGPGLSTAQADEYMSAVLEKVVKSSRDLEIMMADAVTPADQARSCELYIGFYRQTLLMPEAHAAGLLRFMAAQ
jgi:hypothetical protein